MDEEKRQAPDWEVSPANPEARCSPDGIWCEDILPVLAWEVAENRVVLPEDLQRIVGFDAPVLRWAAVKHRTVLEMHTRDRHVVEQLSRFLVAWAYVGVEPPPHTDQYRVLFPDRSGRWYAVTIGRDMHGSHNVVTVFGGSDRRFLRNRLSRLTGVVAREK